MQPTENTKKRCMNNNISSLSSSQGHKNSMRASFCAFCGGRFVSRTARRLYCCTRCRRSFQNERRRGERAEAMLKGAPSPWRHDPWERDDEALYENALLDASPLEGQPLQASPGQGKACSRRPGAR